MFHKRNYIRNALRSLKKPTKLDEIMKAVPKPKGAIPSFGLPRWKIMPLDAKIPLIPGPKNAYNFTRNKIGCSLFVGSKNADFDLNDPYNHIIDFSYDPLHDRHLADYFAKEHIRQRMINRGFITKNLDAICTVKEYNMYRAYLKKLYSDSIKEALRHQAELREDQRVLARADFEAEKDFARIKHRENKKALKDRYSKELSHKAKERRKLQRKKAVEEKERIKRIELNKKNKLQRIILKSKLHAEEVKRKQQMNKWQARQKIVNILLKRRKKENIRKKTRQERLLREADSKQRNMEEKWTQRRIFQEEQIALEQFLLQYAKQQRKLFIKDYKRQVENERRKIEESVAKSSQFKTCYGIRHASRKPKKCCKTGKHKKQKTSSSVHQVLGK